MFRRGRLESSGRCEMIDLVKYVKHSTAFGEMVRTSRFNAPSYCAFEQLHAGHVYFSGLRRENTTKFELL
jgi:hypothetical protein